MSEHGSAQHSTIPPLPATLPPTPTDGSASLLTMAQVTREREYTESELPCDDGDDEVCGNQVGIGRAVREEGALRRSHTHQPKNGRASKKGRRNRKEIRPFPVLYNLSLSFRWRGIM